MKSSLKKTCPNCDKVLMDQRALDAHCSLFCRSSVTDVNEENVVGSRMIPGDTSRRCVFCSLTLDSKPELLNHAATHLRCHLCPVSKTHFKSLSHMKGHFELQHGFTPCLWCHLIFHSRESLLLHYKEVHLSSEEELRNPSLPLSQILESTLLKESSLSISQIFRSIETQYPFFYVMDTSGEWKKEIIFELHFNSRIGDSLSDKSHPDTLFKLECIEEVVLLTEESQGPLTKKASSLHFPEHIFQLVYEDEDVGVEKSRLVLSEAEEDIRRQEWFFRKAQAKPWRIYGMCSLCGRLFADNESLSEHIRHGCGSEAVEHLQNNKDHHVEANAKCPFCKGSQFKSFRELVIHVLNGICSSLPKDLPPTVCTLCPSFPLQNEQRVHFLSRHMERIEKKSQSSLCALCKKLCSSQSGLRSHFVRSHIGGLWTCSVCHAQFFSLDSYKTHASQIHPILPLREQEDESKACSICQIVFTSTDDRDRHLRTTTFHPVCWVCDMPAGSWEDLTTHFESNQSDHSPFYCQDCPKLFHKRKHKSLHMQLQHSKGLKDPVERIFTLFNTNQSSKVDHERDLSFKNSGLLSCKACSRETAKFQCAICFYPVHSLTELRSHVVKAKHIDLSCPSCLTHFLTPPELLSHYYKHVAHLPPNRRLLITSDEENPNEESDDYPSNELLSLSPDLSLACSRCKSSHIQNRMDLLQHALTHHPDIFQRVTCGSCNNQFSSKKLLREHNEELCKKYSPSIDV